MWYIGNKGYKLKAVFRKDSEMPKTMFGQIAKKKLLIETE